MDKYGVAEETSGEDFEKAAAEGCPKCGGKVQKFGNILKCVSCGTEPFESKKE